VSFDAPRAEPPARALPAPPDLPPAELLDRRLLDWGAQLAAAAEAAPPGGGGAPGAGGRERSPAGGAASALDTGELDMSAFGMGGAQPAASALDTGMLDMSAFGMGGGAEPGEMGSGGPAASALDTGMLDMSAFGMGGSAEPGDARGGGQEASVLDSGMLDMSAFGMGGSSHDAAPPAPPAGGGAAAAGSGRQAAPEVTLRKQAAARFSALSDAELAKLRGLLGVPGGPAPRPGRRQAPDADGEPRVDGEAGATALGLEPGAVRELGRLAGAVSACGGDPARPPPDLDPLDDAGRRALLALQARRRPAPPARCCAPWSVCAGLRRMCAPPCTRRPWSVLRCAGRSVGAPGQHRGGTLASHNGLLPA